MKKFLMALAICLISAQSQAAAPATAEDAAIYYIEKLRKQPQDTSDARHRYYEISKQALRLLVLGEFKGVDEGLSINYDVRRRTLRASEEKTFNTLLEFTARARHPMNPFKFLKLEESAKSQEQRAQIIEVRRRYGNLRAGLPVNSTLIQRVNQLARDGMDKYAQLVQSVKEQKIEYDAKQMADTMHLFRKRLRQIHFNHQTARDTGLRFFYVKYLLGGNAQQYLRADTLKTLALLQNVYGQGNAFAYEDTKDSTLPYAFFTQYLTVRNEEIDITLYSFFYGILDSLSNLKGEEWFPLSTDDAGDANIKKPDKNATLKKQDFETLERELTFVNAQLDLALGSTPTTFAGKMAVIAPPKVKTDTQFGNTVARLAKEIPNAANMTKENLAKAIQAKYADKLIASDAKIMAALSQYVFYDEPDEDE